MNTRAPSCGNYDWAKGKLQYTNLQTNVGHGQCYTDTPKLMYVMDSVIQ